MCICICDITLSISLQLLLRKKLEDALRIGDQRLHDRCCALQRGLLPAGAPPKKRGPGQLLSSPHNSARVAAVLVATA